MSKQAITTWHGKFSVSSKWKTLTKQKGNMPNIIYKIINSGPAKILNQTSWEWDGDTTIVIIIIILIIAATVYRMP